MATKPAGLVVLVNGTSLTGPTTFTSWRGWPLRLEAPSPQGSRVFASWSNGRARAHTVVTPGRNRTYTATFRLR